MNREPKKDKPKNLNTPKSNSRILVVGKVVILIAVVAFSIFGYKETWDFFNRIPQGADFCNYYITDFAVKELFIQNIYDVSNATIASDALFREAVATDQTLLASISRC